MVRVVQERDAAERSWPHMCDLYVAMCENPLAINFPRRLLQYPAYLPLPFRINTAWSKVAGIHNLTPVRPSLAAAKPRTLTHKPNNHGHGSAIVVASPANGVMVGHLCYQVAYLMQPILAYSWIMSAATTSASFAFLEATGAGVLLNATLTLLCRLFSKVRRFHTFHKYSLSWHH